MAAELEPLTMRSVAKIADKKVRIAIVRFLMWDAYGKQTIRVSKTA